MCIRDSLETCSFELTPPKIDFVQTHQNANDLTLKKSNNGIVIGNIYEHLHLIKL